MAWMGNVTTGLVIAERAAVAFGHPGRTQVASRVAYERGSS
jgi:hypothetical protein